MRGLLKFIYCLRQQIYRRLRLWRQHCTSSDKREY